MEVDQSHKNLSMAVAAGILGLMKPGREFLWGWMGKEWILVYRPGRMINDVGANFQRDSGSYDDFPVCAPSNTFW
jgi:hypothetical protein